MFATGVSAWRRRGRSIVVAVAIITTAAARQFVKNVRNRVETVILANNAAITTITAAVACFSVSVRDYSNAATANVVVVTFFVDACD